MNKVKPYEAKKPYVLHLRISAQTSELLKEISLNTGIEASNLARMLLLSNLKRLRSDAIKHGWENLDIIIKHD